MYIMSCQVFVKAGVTLAIMPGATIYSTPTGPDGKAPALVIEQGAYILAEGTEDLPITFTALNRLGFAEMSQVAALKGGMGKSAANEMTQLKNQL